MRWGRGPEVTKQLILTLTLTLLLTITITYPNHNPNVGVTLEINHCSLVVAWAVIE